MLLADGFWEIRNLTDTVAVVGFLVTVFSIWFSWYLARRDLERRLTAERDRTTRRLTLLLMRSDLSRVYWLLREARQAYQAKDQARTLDRCEWAEYFLSQLPDPAQGEERELLRKAEDDIRLVLKSVRAQLKKPARKDEVSEKQIERLSTALTRLAGFERLIETRLLGAHDVRPDDSGTS